jgi:hypothetical protein
LRIKESKYIVLRFDILICITLSLDGVENQHLWAGRHPRAGNQHSCFKRIGELCGWICWSLFGTPPPLRLEASEKKSEIWDDKYLLFSRKLMNA